MNTSQAISILHTVVDDINKEDCECEKKRLSSILVNTCRNVLGVLIKDPKTWFCNVCSCKKKWIEEMIGKRDEAKNLKDYSKADEIRAELMKNNIIIEDTKNGTIWKNKC